MRIIRSTRLKQAKDTTHRIHPHPRVKPVKPRPPVHPGADIELGDYEMGEEPGESDAPDHT